MTQKITLNQKQCPDGLNRGFCDILKPIFGCQGCDHPLLPQTPVSYDPLVQSCFPGCQAIDSFMLPILIAMAV